MTSILASAATLIASMIPGFLLTPANPAAILGFMVVGACVLFVARDYASPRLTRHGLRR
jgi:hypothetical protein